MAVFRIIVAGLDAQLLFPVEYSRMDTSSNMGFSYPSTYTRHHPPTSVSPSTTMDPSRLVSLVLSLLRTDTPASNPLNLGFFCARLVKTSLPTTMVAGLLPYLIR